jgi:hypothetical protein
LYYTPYVASLRVYEPIESFKLEVQTHWSEIGVDSFNLRLEQFSALTRTITNLSPRLDYDGVYVLDYGKKRYVAPWSTAIRCEAAIAEFNLIVPTSIVNLFIPSNGQYSHNDISSNYNYTVPHILTSRWNIPPRWFALFAPEERTRGINIYGHFTNIRTSKFNALNRCKSTHQTILSTFGPGQVEVEVADLVAWLELFDKDSVIELDYGGLANYLNKILTDSGEIGLEADTSIEDVLTSIAGLAAGDSEEAARGYERVATRWRRVSQLELAN